MEKRIKLGLIILISLIAAASIWVFVFGTKKAVKNTNIQERNYFILEKEISETENKEGVADKKGNIVIEPIYHTVVIPNLSKAVFLVSEENSEKFKAINEKGEEILKEYGELEAITGNSVNTNHRYREHIKFKKDGKYGLIDITGKKIVEPIYENITTVGDDLHNYLVKRDGKYGLLDDRRKCYIKS